MNKKKIIKIKANRQVPSKKEWRDYLTVGQLKKFIKKYKIPDNAKILYQRIEDIYFEKLGWGENSILKPDANYPRDMDEYVVAFSFVGYKDKNLYLTAHY